MAIDLTLPHPTDTAETIAQFIRTHVDSAGRTRTIVALSGGIDSALTAALAVDALGTDNVVAHTLPDGQITPQRDIDDAHRLAEFLNVRCRQIPIGAPLASLQSTLEETGMTGDANAWGNAKARLRMIVNYLVAHEEDGLVLGTGNKSEILVGYYTKYGDAGVDLLPIGAIYKTQVQQLARHLQLPQPIVDKAPSAGLWEGQTDEDELGMPYDRLDRVLVCLQDRGMSVEETASQLETDGTEIARIADMIRTSAHKRAMPPTPDMRQADAATSEQP